MNPKLLALALLTLTALTPGCKPAGETTTKQLDKAQAETKEAAQEMKDYAFAQKAEFVEKMEGQVADLNRDLDQIAARIDKASDTVKATAKPKLQALRDQVAVLNKQLDEARNATESTWDGVKSGFKKAYESSKEGFQQARQWLSDKIAP